MSTVQSQKPFPGFGTEKMSSTTRVVHLLVLVLLAVLWNLVLPGVIAKLAGVFNEAQVRTKLPSGTPKVDQYSDFRNRRSEAKTRLETIEKKLGSELNSPAESNRISSLLMAKKHYEEVLQTRPPIRVVGFFEAHAPYYLLASFLALTLHIYATPPAPFNRKRIFAFVGFVIEAHFLWMGPNWARNFLFDNQERAIYSHVHYDISAACFLFQEVQVLVICILIAWSWSKWTSIADAASTELGAWSLVVTNQDVVAERAEYAGGVFDLWQLHSVILACGFLPWTLFYWQLSIMHDDVRYYSSAFACHILWGISWWIISIPSIETLRNWNQFRNRAVAELVCQNGVNPALFKFVSEASPITSLRVVIVGTASLIAFVLPFLNFLR